MMRSRALPADFDMTQALHSPFGAPPPQHGLGTPLPSPGSYAHFGQPGVRPLTLDTLRRVPEYEAYGQTPHYASPTGMTPSLGGFAFTPPQSATDTMSPASAASNFNFQTQESPRRPPFGMPLGSQPSYAAAHSQMHRPFLQDRLSRPFGETAGSPLRTSVSYSNLGSSALPFSRPPERASSLSEQSSIVQDRQPRSFTGPTGNVSGPYGLGFSCKHSKLLYQRTPLTMCRRPPIAADQRTSFGVSDAH